MTQVRIHEVAKALGQSSKVLMTDLAQAGFEFKTHMAVLEGASLDFVQKKYPDLKEKLLSAEAAKAAEPPKPKKPSTKGSKLITSKSSTAKKSKAAKEAEDATPEVELVHREEGQAGTVTLEQRVVKEGIIRRRRVEPTTETPSSAPVAKVEVTEAPAPAESKAAPAASTTRPAAEGPRNLSASAPVIRRVTMPAPAAPTPKPPVKPEAPKEDVNATATKAAPAVEAPKTSVEKPAAPATPPMATAPVSSAPKAATHVVTRPAGTGVSSSRSTFPPATGRNLSAPSRLKVVEVPNLPPRPPSAAPAARGPGGTAARPTADRAGAPGARRPIAGRGPAEAEVSAEETAKLNAAKKRPGAAKTTEEENRLTKRDLIGMVEEVEITRPTGRRPKKAQVRIEKKATTITTPGAAKRKIRIHDEITVADLADQMGIKGAELVRKLIAMGQMVSLQHHLDVDTATLIASDYKYEVINVAESAETLLANQTEEQETGDLVARAPIVTIMGHVDHGKTSLLDYIRRTRVAAGEAGGITQHIGAYKVVHKGKPITFLDTPGHAAFTAMRARGASVTDLVILVVAADEGAKPQTLEALAHAQSAKVPIIVAINKMDKPEAKPDNVIQELSGKGLVPEAWGGDTMYAKLSAKTGEGVDELLENILLQSEVLDLKASIDKPAKGIVIESRLDKGKGPVATVMVQTGTLKQGHPMVSGSTFGKVRAMFDDAGKPVQEVGPSTPVEILGFDAVPEVGEIVQAVTEDAIARKASELATLAKKKADSLKNSRMSLEDMYKKMQTGETSELRVILKGDVQGSVEAVSDSLEKIVHDKVRVQVIYKAVGGITESDVDLAAASGAIIFGFNVRPTSQAKNLAQRDGVQIKTYEIIYELLDEVKLAMQGLLAPIIKENTLGQAEVREVFNVSKVGPIAGCFVKQGKIVRNGHVRVIRDSVVVYTAKIHSLRRFKDDAKEVQEGFECGIRVENFSDLKPGDILECFENIEIKQAVG